MATIPLISSNASFDEACRLVLEFLRTEIPMGLWSVTRLENGRQTFLSFAGGCNVYGAPVGGGHAWEDSYCVSMVAGVAPNIAPDSHAVPAYAAAGVNAQVPIRAFAGMDIREPDGSLFGTLCGIDPHVQPATITEKLPLLQLMASLLGMVLAAERSRDEAATAAWAAREEAHTDALTGLLNRRGWQVAVAEEQARYELLADPTVVALIDLDQLKRVNDGPGGHAAGDRYIKAAADALSSAVRVHDPVARLGGDEFGVILRRCTIADTPALVARLHRALEDAGVAASIGWAPVTVLAGLTDAIGTADGAMYHAKRARRAASGGGATVPMPRGPVEAGAASRG